jgi:uncharacterized protein (TIGR02246 family)
MSGDCGPTQAGGEIVDSTIEKHRLLGIALGLCMLGSAAGQAGHTHKGNGPSQVRDIALGIISADNARDLERVLAFYGDDAILMPPNEVPVQGKAAIKPRYEKMFASFLPEIVGEIEESQVTGDWAFVRGYNRGRLTPLAGGEARLLNDVYVMILKRTENGAWQIARLIWHPTSDAHAR